MSTRHFPRMVRHWLVKRAQRLNMPVFDIEEATSSEVRILFTLADLDEL